MLKLVSEQRIDIVLWDAGYRGCYKNRPTSLNLGTVVSKWKEIKYEVEPYFLNCTSFGLPQNEHRVMAMILNAHDPRTLDFAAKSMHAVFARFRKLCQVCERQHGCASEWLLADDDPLVLKGLKRRQCLSLIHI